MANWKDFRSQQWVGVKVPGLMQGFQIDRFTTSLALPTCGIDALNEKQFVKTAMKMGVPGDLVFQAVRAKRILNDPADFISRRREARRLNTVSPYADFVDKRKGYGLFAPDALPGIMDAVNAARQIFEKKVVNLSNAKKEFFFNVLEEADLQDYPQLLGIANSEVFRAAATGYLQTVPDLSGIGVFYSPANSSLEKSQQYHTDDIDAFQLKCFINVNDVGADNGPFTFIPADVSTAVRRQLNHHWRGRRLTDEEVLAHCRPEDAVSLVGPAGSGLFVDTSRCLHYGSRCRSGHRLVIMFQYTRRPNLSLESADARTGRTLIVDH
jgi:hypothetical protein